MPHGRNWATCALINNLIYIIGGYKHNYNDRYDPSTNTWTTLAPLPISSLYGATRENPVINGIIYVTHGQDPPSPAYYATVYAYDPSTNTWTQKTTGMNPRDRVACVVTNEILLVIGGRYGATAYRYNEAYFP
jgi:N-acetylneuraminic acid mutarotase